MTKLMQAADVYEVWKVVAFIETITIEYKDGVSVDLERAGKLIPMLAEGYWQSGTEFPVFIHLNHVTTEDAIYHNKKLKIPYYRNERVKAISSGANWELLDNCIEQITGTKPKPHDSKEKTGFQNDWTRTPYERS